MRNIFLNSNYTSQLNPFTSAPVVYLDGCYVNANTHWQFSNGGMFVNCTLDCRTALGRAPRS